MIVVGVLVLDTDDAELLGVYRLSLVVFAAFESDDHVSINVLTAQVDRTVVTPRPQR